MMIAFVTLSAVAFGGLAASIALRSGSASVVQGMFPIVFVVLFLSTAFFPADLMLEPASTVAEYNPLSFIINGVRDPVISAFSGPDIGKAFISIFAIGALSLGLSALALRKRLRDG